MVTKLQRYRAFEIDPPRAMFQFLEEMRAELTERKAQLDKLERHITSIAKGKDASTPVKGVDYYTPQELRDIVNYIHAQIRIPKDGKPGRDGKNGTTPSNKSIRNLIKQELSNLPTNAPLAPTIVNSITERVQEQVDFTARAKEIARALEGLKGAERLDYRSLKNIPGVAAYSDKPIHRGGGSETYYYDLSSLTDGATKSFTIPANTRIVWVGGSDAPGGQYTQTTDYTGSGTTTLTLTSAVAAPSQGATLHIIYVQ